MTLYRHVEFYSSPPTMELYLNAEDIPRVERCYVDRHSLSCLEKLVTGPISKPAELLGAEVALRALIFHDAIDVLVPSYVENYVHDALSVPVVLDAFDENGSNLAAINSVLADADRIDNHCMVDDLYRFADERVAKRYIELHSSNRDKRLRDRKKDPLRNDDVCFWLDVEMGRFERVANDPKEFYSRVLRESPALIKRVLKAIPKTGRAAYFSDAAFSEYLNKAKRYAPSEFFDTIDKDWSNISDSLDHLLLIPIQPLLAIVLSRATNRADIPAEIISLRSEFSKAREQLWFHFDDVKLRTSDPQIIIRILKLIESEARNIIPKGLRTGESSFPINFGMFRRLLMGEYTGLTLAKDAMDFAKQQIKSSIHFVDAADLLVTNLQTVDWANLTRNHFLESEIASLEDAKWE